MSRDSVILTQGLTKRFGAITAVEDLDLDVRAGDVYGFLGANGSGKTTTVRMLLGLVLATSGTIEVLGQTMPRSGRDVLPQVGSMVEGPAFYSQLAGRANLALFDAMDRGSKRRGRAGRVDDALEMVGLDGVDNRPVHAYSLGMKQRLGLANALLRHPRLLVLDEPTNGLDPQGIREIRALLGRLNAEGTTIFISSHLLAEIELMCTRVGVLDRGRMVLQDQMDHLRRGTGRVLVSTPDPDAVRRELGDLVEETVTSADGLESLAVTGVDPAGLNKRLVGAGLAVTGLVEEHHRLEDVVLAAAGDSADRVVRA